MQNPHPLSQVYSFVPIPGAQQHKRPRRRYEEIERMYKCGHQGCEKAYGTLNHLNAHVTMQSHGQKRTPEGKSLSCRKVTYLVSWTLNSLVGLHNMKQALILPLRLIIHLVFGDGVTLSLRGSKFNFRTLVYSASLMLVVRPQLTHTNLSVEFKEIRKEWKARKKEEENARKADEERQRASMSGGAPPDGSATDPASTPTNTTYPPGVRPQLPPIGYAQATQQVPGQYPGAPEQMYQQGNGQMYSTYPHSPYNQGQQVYQQRYIPALWA